MGQPLIDYFPQYEGSNSVVLAGGSLTVFGAGTTDLIDLFSDIDLQNPIVNPVVLDAAGMTPDVYYANGLAVKIEIRDTNGSLFRTKDDLPAFGGPTAGVSIWASDQAYSKGEEVVYLGGRYFSNVDNNVSNVPVDASIPWTRSPFQGVWNTNLTYISTDRVIDLATGLLYIARTITQGDTPATSPTQWAQGEGIGLQTFNIPAEGLNLPATNPAVNNATEISGWIVVTKDFLGITNNQIVQFEVQMPESWDRGPLEVVYTVLSRVVVTGGNEAVFSITATAFGDGEIIDSTPGPFTSTTISGISTPDAQYYSAKVPLVVDNISTPNSWVQFKVEREQDATADTITSTIGLRGVVVRYKTVSSIDNA